MLLNRNLNHRCSARSSHHQANKRYFIAAPNTKMSKFYPDLLILFDGVSSTLPPLSCLLLLLFTVTLCLDLFAAIIFSEKLNLQLHLTRSFIWVCAIRFIAHLSLTSLRLNKGIVKRPSSLNQFSLFPYLSIF